MVRYRFARNGFPYGDPQGILSVLGKVRDTAKRDGPGYSWKPPYEGYSRSYSTVLRLLLDAAKLRKTKLGDLSKMTTRIEVASVPMVEYLIRTVAKDRGPVYPSQPLYVGMPASPTSFKFGTGVIFAGGTCKDNYGNVEEATILGQSLKLQKAAMDSFIGAANEVGGIRLTGSWRSCEAQTRYYNSDPNRYAPPDKTAHCRGLAIDVATDQGAEKLADIKGALSKRGWFQARADEPWHWSAGIRV